jgi:hypothetical protein
MGITAERRARAFGEALTFQGFIDSMQVNQETFLANFAAYQLSAEDKAFFESLTEPVDVLVLAHDWCGDVVANLPLFGKIEQETGKLRLHILPRDPDNGDIAATYPHADGYNHIPTYIFFNQAGEELGVFIERPDEITAQMAEWRETFWQNHPELEGRGKPLGELSPEARKGLLGYFKERRAEVRDQEKAAILKAIQPILSRVPARI